MSYYLRMFSYPDRTITQVWNIEDDRATLLGVASPEQGVGSFYKADPGETIWEAIRRMTPWFEPDGENPFHKINLEPGQYYPRIARPINQHFDGSPGWSPGALHEASAIAVAQSQLSVLTQQLERICQTIHPTEKTFDAFGHDIRNLLILASTEVESHWRAVLVANGRQKGTFNTKDYVALCEAMKLEEYAVTFPAYPWIEAIAPFKGWDSSAPTATLKWYDAYNAVKHNRENEFERATLRRAFEAVTACSILMTAQFGIHQTRQCQADWQSFFHISAFPQWGLSDVYIYPYNGGEWSPVSFNFSIDQTSRRYISKVQID